MNQKKTFWDVITSYSIEIPTIQRDYTYGREKAKTISRKLITDILDPLAPNNTSQNLHLDFIYGKLEGVDNHQHLERNKQSIDTLLYSLKGYAHHLYIDVDYKTIAKKRESADIITFIPLDGQQRLTTLFLVHWYIAAQLKNEEAINKLKRFNYATRKSSSDFLKMLCELKDLEVRKNYSISEQIINNELFFSFWKKDPTVSSILVVLDEIEKQCEIRSIDFQIAWKKLIRQHRITFDFFDLDDFDLTDELYVKMNARGKKLSHFENLKAWMIKDLSSSISVKRWKNKMDIDWNDLFWNSKAKEDTEIDIAYLQYFKILFLGDLILNGNPSEEDLEILRISVEESPLDIFKTNLSFEKNLNSYLELLDYIEVVRLDININPLFKKRTVKNFIFKENKFTWWDATLHYAITRYILVAKGDFTYFNQWLRVISNLIYNTPIESPKLYKEACESIFKLLSVLENKPVYKTLATFEEATIEFFIPTQRNEEILKAKRIVDDIENNWEALFIELEQHEYFFGQIGFIFKLVDEDNSYLVFENAARRAQAIFSEDILNNYNNLLFRAFLTQGNCFFKVGNNLIFPSSIRGTLRNRNENWRRFINQQPDILKKLILHPDINTGKTLDSLKKIIKSSNNTDPFLFQIIDNYKLLKYSQKNHIRKHGGGYYLLNSTRIFGYYKEVHTYYWYLNNKDSFKVNLAYAKGKGEDELCETGIFIDSKILVYFDFETEKFKVDINDKKEFETIDEAVEMATEFLELENMPAKQPTISL